MEKRIKKMIRILSDHFHVREPKFSFIEGKYSYYEPRQRKIFLTTLHKSFSKQVEYTILHEFAHYLNDLLYRRTGHDSNFCRLLAEIINFWGTKFFRGISEYTAVHKSIQPICSLIPKKPSHFFRPETFLYKSGTLVILKEIEISKIISEYPIKEGTVGMVLDAFKQGSVFPRIFYDIEVLVPDWKNPVRIIVEEKNIKGVASLDLIKDKPLGEY